MATDGVGLPANDKPDTDKRAAASEPSVLESSASTKSGDEKPTQTNEAPKKITLKRDRIDFINITILIFAFFAAVAAAVEAHRLADLTQTAINDARAVSKQQAADTATSLRIAQTAADAASKQAEALRGNLRFDTLSPVSPIMQQPPPGEKQDVIAWSLNAFISNSGGTDIRNYTGWWYIQPIDLPVPLPIEQRMDIPCPAINSPNVISKDIVLTEPTIISAGASRQLIALRIPIEDVRSAASLPLASKIIFAMGHGEYNDIFLHTPLHHLDWCIMIHPVNVDRFAYSPFFKRLTGD